LEGGPLREKGEILADSLQSVIDQAVGE